MKIRAAANRLTPRDLPNSSFIVFDDFALPSWRGNSSKPATKITASNAAISHSAVLNPTRSSNSPPRKKPMPFIAFFEPVNQATHRNSCPLPSAEVALIADLEAVLVRSLATPAIPWREDDPGDRRYGSPTGGEHGKHDQPCDLQRLTDREHPRNAEPRSEIAAGQIGCRYPPLHKAGRETRA